MFFCFVFKRILVEIRRPPPAPRGYWPGSGPSHVQATVQAKHNPRNNPPPKWDIHQI